jgi:threonylcarbamoyladenosine tRNA methylthiotransferase MtaB
MAGFHIEHFGCRAARADGEAIGGRLLAAGHCVQHGPQADVVIVNTCSVTAEADRAARAFIRRTHRTNPAAKIVVTGCYAQRAPEELAGMAGVAAVVGNSHKALAPEIVLGLTRGASGPEALPQVVPVLSLLASSPAQGSSAHAAPVWADDRFAHSLLEEAQLVPGEQTRPNLKIQEGCGNRCTFCVIPWTRGASKSLPREAVFRQVEGFVAAGGNELVLSGINLGRWGQDLPERRRFSALVREILERTALPRLRLSSIEPMDWDEELIGLMREFSGSRLARHAHLPLQSGSDAVLRRMHRRYRPWHYADKVESLLRAAGPDLTLGADVMAGFPGETDAEFEETMEFLRRLPFAYLHLFPFSPRPGTRGWTLHAADPVPAEVVERRMRALRTLAAEKMRLHRSRFVGRELEAITLHTPAALAAEGKTAVLTENFLPVEMEGRIESNRLVRVRIRGLGEKAELEGCAA